MRIVKGDRYLAIAIVAALVVRVAALASNWESLAQDDDAYGRLAVYWSEAGTFGFPTYLPSADPDPNSVAAATRVVGSLATNVPAMRPTAYRPPLYPWLLSWLVSDGRLSLIAVAVMHLWLGLASVGLTYAIARRLRLGWPLLPALAVAFDPILLRGSQLVMTETLITFFAVAIWGLWQQIVLPMESHADSETQSQTAGRRSSRTAALGSFALLGWVLGLAVLTRPTMLPWAACLIALSAYFAYLQSCRSGASSAVSARASAGWAGVVGVVLTLTLLPWVIRNARVMGAPMWATTHGGYTLLLANNPSLYAHFRSRGPSRDWDASDFHRHWAARDHGDPTQLAFWQQPTRGEPSPPVLDSPADELRDDTLAEQSAKATIAREKGIFALSCVYRIGWFWALAPQDASPPVRLAIGLWYAAWYLGALWGIVRLGRAWRLPVWLGAAAFVLTLTLIHGVYWSNMRMRAPLMPIVYVVAAVPFARRLSAGP